ncbi:MAG: InlB B-repeat-containing protein [Chitinispirillaceae bacterium]|nr:InlB B-repeat-containing protein [Chitinispirillaceae bacterium]
MTFNTHGGTPVPSDTVNHGALLTEPTSARPGLTLVGWYMESGYQNRWNFLSNAVTIPLIIPSMQVTVIPM